LAPGKPVGTSAVLASSLGDGSERTGVGFGTTMGGSGERLLRPK